MGKGFAYIVRTSVSRSSIDPDILGITIDCIAETCPGYVSHSIPLCTENGNTEIRIILDRAIRSGPGFYLIDQLESELRGLGEEDRIVLGIREQ